MTQLLDNQSSVSSPSSVSWLRRTARQLLVLAAIAGCLLFTPSAAVAAKKKKEEEQPTKSYVVPYMIVMMMVGVGVMIVCRPNGRAEKLEEKKKDEAEE